MSTEVDFVLSELHADGRPQAAAGRESPSDAKDDSQTIYTSRFPLLFLPAVAGSKSKSCSSSSSSSLSSDDDSHPAPIISRNQPGVKRPRRQIVRADSSGDLDVPRRRGRRRWGATPRFISIRHCGVATPIADVGMQVWRGACLLADWLLSGTTASTGPAFGPAPSPSPLIFELGGGVGLVGVAAAAAYDNVVITDVHDGALRLAAANVVDNADVIMTWRRRRAAGAGAACQTEQPQMDHALPANGSSKYGGGGAVGSAGCGSAASPGIGEEPAAWEAFRTLSATRGGSGAGCTVELCRLDWFDFLAYGRSALDVEAIVAALVAAETEEAEAGSGGAGGKGAAAAAEARVCTAAKVQGTGKAAAGGVATEEAEGHRAGLTTTVPIALAGSPTGAAVVAVASNGESAAALVPGSAHANTQSEEQAVGSPGTRSSISGIDLPPDGAPAGHTGVEVVVGGGMGRMARAIAGTHSLCLVAADTVYDTVLTEAFVRCAAALMSYHGVVRHRRDAAWHGHGGGNAFNGDASAGEGGDGSCYVRGGGSGGDNGKTGSLETASSLSGPETRRSAVPSARLIVSMEKRLNFTIRDMAVTAPAFDDFLSYVLAEVSPLHGSSRHGTRHNTMADGAGDGPQGHCWQGAAGPRLSERDFLGAAGPPSARVNTGQGGAARPGGSSVAEGADTGAADGGGAAEGEGAPEPRRPLFRGRRLDVAQVPQVLQYERCEQLELWELTLL